LDQYETAFLTSAAEGYQNKMILATLYSFRNYIAIPVTLELINNIIPQNSTQILIITRYISM
jgi:hypothetical protein